MDRSFVAKSDQKPKNRMNKTKVMRSRFHFICNIFFLSFLRAMIVNRKKTHFAPTDPVLMKMAIPLVEFRLQNPINFESILKIKISLFLRTLRSFILKEIQKFTFNTLILVKSLTYFVSGLETP